MPTSEPVTRHALLPDPGQARTLDELVERLRLLKVWAGDPSYTTIRDRINAAWNGPLRPVDELAKKSTVADCFKAGRRRLNTDLVLAVVRALHADEGYVAQWRQALRVVGGETWAAGQVRAQDTLPDDIAEFIGRGAQLDQLRQGARRGTAAVIATIEGMAGVGKTQLAVHAGHLLAREEPFDQVLFVNLRGFHADPGQPPAEPAAVLDSFLRLLGVPGQEIPHEVGARAAAYRERLAGARALVVLDNAADERQVEPLLPDGPGCVTLITSRRSLVVPPAAIRLSVDVFSSAEALEVLARVAPGVPVGDDPTAPARVSRRCGYLPLALVLLAGHMRAKPEWTVTDHAEWLVERQRDRKLDSGVELALDLSYRHLPADRQRVFRLLALHPGHDLDTYAAAALAGTDLSTARDHLEDLSRDHLLQQAAPGRFEFHDLVRAHAANRAADEDRPPSRHDAVTRLLDHYLSTAATATTALFPADQRPRPRTPQAATPAPPLADPAAARGWLDTERANLIAAAGHAADHGWPDHAVRLAGVLFRYLDGGHFSDALAIHTHARRAAHRSGDCAAEATALSDLGIVHQRLGRHEEATGLHEQAIAQFRELGDRLGEARAMTHLGNAYWHLGRYQRAADRHQAALILFRELGHRYGEASALGNLGHVYWQWGRYEQAADHYQQTLVLFRELGDRLGEAHALDDLGGTCQKLGRHDETADHHQRAIALFRELGDRLGEAHALSNLGIAYQELGRHDEAADHHQQAISLFRDIGNRDGETASLNNLGDAVLANGRPDQARAHHAAALVHANALNDRYEQARAHNGLALAHRAGNDPGPARHHWQRALDLYTELDVPEAGQVRANLATLD
jgi:tetratricopeptide (TPR) repeat protein